MTFYRQCVLKRKNTITASGGYIQQSAWIPEKYAKKGRFLKLKRKENESLVAQDSTEGPHMDWKDGWQVVSVGHRASEKQVRMYERQHLKQRGESDI